MNAPERFVFEGEILSRDDVVRVVYLPHLIKRERAIYGLPAGSSIAELVGATQNDNPTWRPACGLIVTINGDPVLRKYWHRVRVKKGAHVVVRAVPLGHSGGNIFRGLLMLAVMVAATALFTPGGLLIGETVLGLGGLAWGVSTAAITATVWAGSLALGALFPPSALKARESERSYSLSARTNMAAKWNPIPVMLGRTRVYPKYAAQPYSEFAGDNQYLYMLLVWGYGPMKIEDIRIGTTSIDDFDDVDIQTFEGYASDKKQTLYTSEVVQDDFQIEVRQKDKNTKKEPTLVRTSADDAGRIAIDLVAPQGLHDVNKKGKHGGWDGPIRVAIDVYIREHGRYDGEDEGWRLLGRIEVSGKTHDPIRKSFSWTRDGGQWDIKLKRVTSDYDDKEGEFLAQIYWTAIRTHRLGDPPIEFDKPLAITALKIKATNQLNGAINDLNAICASLALSYDGKKWVRRETSNPADLFRLVLQGPANARACKDSRLDLPMIEAFAEHCDKNGYRFDMYRDFSASVRETLKDICASARAAPTLRDRLWSVAWEDGEAPVVQHFTPRNSRDFKFTQSYKALPHGLRCKFSNKREDWQEDEILVYDDGYDKKSATLFEAAEFPGLTDPDQVHRQARYRLRAAKARPAVYTITVDFEHLAAQLYDRVAMAHDVIDKGVSSGRIGAVEGRVLTLDEPFSPATGKHYAIRIRKKDGSSLIRRFDFAETGGAVATITLKGSADCEAGDLYSLGERGEETGLYRILAIRPADHLAAEIDLVDDGGDLGAGDDETADTSARAAKGERATLRPSNLRFKQSVRSGGGAAHGLIQLWWDVPFGLEATSFEVNAIDETGAVPRITVAGERRDCEFRDLAKGRWWFRVRGLLADHKFTPWSDELVAQIAYDDEMLPWVTDLALVNATSDTEFNGVDTEFSWVNHFPQQEKFPSAQSPFYARNIVTIYDSAANDRLRVDYTDRAAYSYTLALNRADNAEFGRDAARNLRIEVAVEDTLGRVSQAVRLIVTNPPPSVIAPVVKSGMAQVFVSWELSKQPDFAGVVLWLSKTKGFDPKKTDPAYDGPGSMAILPAEPGGYYLRAAAYDAFGKGQLNISGEMRVEVYEIDIDTAPPPVPEGLTLSQTQKTAPDGAAIYGLQASWSAVDASDLAFYEVRIREKGGNSVSVQTPGTAYEWPNVMAGTAFTVGLRAVDANGNKSNWSAMRQKTISGDKTAPAAPEHLKATAGFDSFFLEWDPVTDRDLDHYELEFERQPNSGIDRSYFDLVRNENAAGLLDATRRFNRVIDALKF
ncbi:MAG: host specificity factor TipJ family phage tail protein [Hyphomicrobiales bacterium]